MFFSIKIIYFSCFDYCYKIKASVWPTNLFCLFIYSVPLESNLSGLSRNHVSFTSLHTNGNEANIFTITIIDYEHVIAASMPYTKASYHLFVRSFSHLFIHTFMSLFIYTQTTIVMRFIIYLFIFFKLRYIYYFIVDLY